MRSAKLLLLGMAAIVCLAATPAIGQECGDANSDGSVNISDLVYLMVTLGENPDYPITEATADCDGKAGITVGDIAALVRYMFVDLNPAGLDCSRSGEYLFNPSSADTVFIPYINSIPDGMDEISLPVLTNLQADTRGFYLPVRAGSATCYLFEITGIERTSTAMGIANGFALRTGFGSQTDTIVMLAVPPQPEEDLVGPRSLYAIDFARTGPGTGSINPIPVDRPGNLKLVVVKDDGLYLPTVVMYEYVIPPPELTVSETTLGYTLMAGNVSITTHEVSFTTEGMPVTFDLDISDPWIVIGDLPAGPHSTPLTITVAVDATALGIGDYSGQISIVDLDPADSPSNTTVINVTAHITDPLALPAGDVNCDGILSIGDVAMIVYHLFINVSPIPPCE